MKCTACSGKTDGTLPLSVGARQDGYMHERLKGVGGTWGLDKDVPWRGPQRLSVVRCGRGRFAAALSGITTSGDAILTYPTPSTVLAAALLDSGVLRHMSYRTSQLQRSQGRQPSAACILVLLLLRVLIFRLSCGKATRGGRCCPLHVHVHSTV
jgi:hypothetical protein